MSVTFDSDPLTERFEILGFPEVTLELESDRPNALVVVRLCEVAPDGSSTLVTRALQNLTHRDSDEFPEQLEPGKRYSVTVRLDACGHAFAPGNRIRIGVSPTYWPWAWPSPEAATLTILTGASRLTLPIRPPSPADEQLMPFARRRSRHRFPPHFYSRGRRAATSPAISRPGVSGSCMTGTWEASRACRTGSSAAIRTPRRSRSSRATRCRRRCDAG